MFKNRVSKKKLLLPTFFSLAFVSILYLLGTFGYLENIINWGETRYNDELSFVAIAKNEGPYIKEWIEFHKLVGVTRFYIYDNESTDNLEDVLKDYINSGEVVYKYFPGRAQQLIAYQEAINDYKDKTKYMGFIDLDEFVVPVEENSIVYIIDDIMKKDSKIAGVGINWLVYGSSELINRPDGLVTENYKYRSLNDFEANKHIKTVCNPRRVVKILDPHSCEYEKNYYCVNEDGYRIDGPFNNNCSYKKLRINHYFCKSQSEYIKKKDRGLADHADNLQRTMVDFYAHDKNDVYDYIMERYVTELKAKLVFDYQFNSKLNNDNLFAYLPWDNQKKRCRSFELVAGL